MDQALAVRCPAHHETMMTVTASWAFHGEEPGGRPRIGLDVAFDGLPPAGNWQVHMVTLRCPDCDATLQLYVR